VCIDYQWNEEEAVLANDRDGAAPCSLLAPLLLHGPGTAPFYT